MSLYRGRGGRQYPVDPFGALEDFKILLNKAQRQTVREFSRKTPGSLGTKLVIVIEPFQNWAENGMFVHAIRDAFALVSRIIGFWIHHTHRCVVTRYGPLPQIVKRHGSSNRSRAPQPQEY